MKNKKDENQVKAKESKVFQRSKQVEQYIKDVVEKQDIYLGDGDYKANICGLTVYPAISSKIAGRCVKSGNQLRFFSGYDYLIEVSGDLWDLLKPQIKYLLIYHELLHVDVCWSKNGEKIMYKLKDHNIKDFKEIIQKYGINWLNEIDLLTASLADDQLDADL